MPSDPLANRKTIFEALVAKVRANIADILTSETADGDFRYSDDGIDVRYNDGAWHASIWRRSDAKNVLAIECRRAVGTRWLVVVTPHDPDDPMFVLRWPDPGFRSTLVAALESLKP